MNKETLVNQIQTRIKEVRDQSNKEFAYTREYCNKSRGYDGEIKALEYVLKLLTERGLGNE